MPDTPPTSAACTCHTVWPGQDYGPCPVHAGQMSANATWLTEFHPERYEIDGEVYLRCPTCEEWSPCRVRVAFGLVDEAIRTVRKSIAWLDANNRGHINEDRFLASIPEWWEAPTDG